MATRQEWMTLQQDWDQSGLGTYLLYDFWSPDDGLCVLAGFDFSAHRLRTPYELDWTDTLSPATFQGLSCKADEIEAATLVDRMQNDLIHLHMIWANSRRDEEAEGYPPAFFIEWALSKSFTPDWLDWAIGTGRYIPKQEVDKANLTVLPELAVATQAGAHADTPATKVEALPVVSPSIKEISGKMPNVKIGQLAIKAARQIECETSKRATAKQVIKILQSWVDHKDNPEAVTELTEKIPNGVKWVTRAGKENDYDINACQKTLETWNKSRD